MTIRLPSFSFRQVFQIDGYRPVCYFTVGNYVESLKYCTMAISWLMIGIESVFHRIQRADLLTSASSEKVKL
jgi:hypothetical protein